MTIFRFAMVVYFFTLVVALLGRVNRINRQQKQIIEALRRLDPTWSLEDAGHASATAQELAARWLPRARVLGVITGLFVGVVLGAVVLGAALWSF